MLYIDNASIKAQDVCYVYINDRASDFPFQKKQFSVKKSEIPFRFRFIIGNVELDEITIYRKKVRQNGTISAGTEEKEHN